MFNRHHGKLLEEGASGFLQKRLAPEDDKESNKDVNWSSFNELCSSSSKNTSFGSKNWASVYLASTPQQAAELGLNFPGVDEVSKKFSCFFIFCFLLFFIILIFVCVYLRSGD